MPSAVDPRHEERERERMRGLGSEDAPWTCGPPEGADLNLDSMRSLPGGGREGIMASEELAAYWERWGLPSSLLAGRRPRDPDSTMLEEARRRVAESRERWARRADRGA